jgi:DNA-binding beta-propeller fold protein YncE
MQNWRIEDIKYTPDKKYIIMPDYRSNSIYLMTNDDEKKISLIKSSKLIYPHGIVFIDDNHFCITNRFHKGNISIFKFPKIDIKTEYILNPLISVDENMASGVVYYNSYLYIVCNDNRVLKMQIDSNIKILNKTLLIQNRLNLPDGIGINSNASIIACSNHNTGEVLLYKNDDQLNYRTCPFKIFTGQLFPHGLMFSSDDKYLVVTDAGSKYIFIYSMDDDKKYINQVVSNSNFLQINLEEGGMKGIDINDNEIILSYDKHPYNCFKFNDLLTEPTQDIVNDLKKLEYKLMSTKRFLRKWIYN